MVTLHVSVSRTGDSVNYAYILQAQRSVIETMIMVAGVNWEFWRSRCKHSVAVHAIGVGNCLSIENLKRRSRPLHRDDRSASFQARIWQDHETKAGAMADLVCGAL